MRLKYLFLFVLIALSMTAFSQIEGDVRDKANNRIPKAKIIAIDSTNRTVDSVITDESGFYRFTNLQPGNYLIEARATGFITRQYKNVIARIKVKNPAVGNDVSNASRLQIVLSPAKK